MQAIEDGLLLREHAHRVANDMAVAAAALRIAARRLGGDAAVGSAAARLEGSSRVQRLLCVRPTEAVIDVTAVLSEICAAMSLARPGAVEVVGATLPMPGGDARLVAMCVHELVGNALRYAGSAGRGVRVEVACDRDAATVAVVDCGGARDWSRAGGQGSGIVDQLAARLGGTVVRNVLVSGGVVALHLPVAAGGGPTAGVALELEAA